MDQWLSAVVDGQCSMSHRSVASIKKHVGSLTALAAAARRRRVHLLLLGDDRGTPLVAASVKPFRVLS